ncbi:unnamed protein product [Clonostachys byssicola]|uniref:Alpha/beta hydrolase fold-3 domain-containing protein n=1 Tax=Clonostachys byssicola TaxID=160290 RepID=A0A9N9U529_9HYPO|nr:unnamed protein product [Clonostachys byssicola]
MATYTTQRPPYDTELMSFIPPVPEIAFAHTKQDLVQHRQFFGLVTDPNRERIISDPDITVTERIIPGARGDITLSVLTPKKPKGSRIDRQSGILHLHSGGLTAGNRFTGAELVWEWVKELDAVAVLVEYRQPPEHPFPAPLEDCYASLLWMAEHADELGFNCELLMIEGQSAGGGLAAATVLMARDKDGPKVCAQLLCTPMLDDRLLRQEGVSHLAAPARATDLSGLPPAYIDVSSAEPFRDEAVAYALA